MVSQMRLEAEYRLVKSRFPQFKLKKLRNDSFAFTGTLKTNRNNNYEILIILDSNYPTIMPKVYIISPDVKCDRHMFNDDQLCLCLEEDWSPNYTVTTTIGWTAHWLHNFEIYSRSGIWPAKEV